ncbi:MAG: FprA family A-type flavoprotein [Candidatus Omnitrophica bacterium]|nr:FprA family A-type flavoprotein [Candidatus Omnitrophota bacterium]
MATIPLTEKISWIGVNDFETELFEALWPIPQGISYNSYLIRDDKTALIDAVKRNFSDDFMMSLESTLAGKALDYLVINHIEPDHSGAIAPLAGRYPKMCIVGNEKTISLLKGFYNIANPVKIITENEKISLGRHTFEFFMTPMAHWPETMMTYERTTQTLFSGDVFGGFGTLPGGIFDDEVDIEALTPEIRRYFSNVIGKYCLPVQKAIEKIKPLPIKILASTHGPVYREAPQRIINLYSGWSRQETKPGAVIAYASMYGHTEKMAEAVGQGLTENGVKETQIFNVSKTHASFILSEIWVHKALVLGSCTYNGKIFPLMNGLLELLENTGLHGRSLGLFGSFSWSASPLSRLKDFSQKGPWKLISPCPEAKCAPADDVLKACYTLGQNLAKDMLSPNSKQ